MNIDEIRKIMNIVSEAENSNGLQVVHGDDGSLLYIITDLPSTMTDEDLYALINRSFTEEELEMRDDFGMWFVDNEATVDQFGGMDRGDVEVMTWEEVVAKEKADTNDDSGVYPFD